MLRTYATRSLIASTSRKSSFSAPGMDFRSHVAPPSTVRRMVPCSPLAHAIVRSTALTPRRRAVAPPASGVHPGAIVSVSVTLALSMTSSRGNARARYASPSAKSGSCCPARMPPPEDSPYSALSASAAFIPSITLPNTTNGSLSCVAELSCRLMNACVVRPFGSLNAYATVPRRFEMPRHGSSGIKRGRHSDATAGSAAMPNCAH